MYLYQWKWLEGVANPPRDTGRAGEGMPRDYCAWTLGLSDR